MVALPVAAIAVDAGGATAAQPISVTAHIEARTGSRVWFFILVSCKLSRCSRWLLTDCVGKAN
jgi:phage terminase large subunit GpA-like protein